MSIITASELLDQWPCVYSFKQKNGDKTYCLSRPNESMVTFLHRVADLLRRLPADSSVIASDLERISSRITAISKEVQQAESELASAKSTEEKLSLAEKCVSLLKAQKEIEYEQADVQIPRKMWEIALDEVKMRIVDIERATF